MSFIQPDSFSTDSLGRGVRLAFYFCFNLGDAPQVGM